VQLGHGIMSGTTSLAHTDLAPPPSAPPSLGQGGEDGRSAGRGVSACCDSRMHCAHLHGCIMCQPCSVAAALATQREQAVCDVIAYQGSQALIQHQAGLVFLAGCKMSQRPPSCKRALMLASTFEGDIRIHAAHTRLHTPLCCDGMIPRFTYHQYIIANTTQKLHWHACTRGQVHAPVVLPHALRCTGAAVLWAQAQGPNKLGHMYSYQL